MNLLKKIMPKAAAGVEGVLVRLVEMSQMGIEVTRVASLSHKTLHDRNGGVLQTQGEMSQSIWFVSKASC